MQRIFNTKSESIELFRQFDQNKFVNHPFYVNAPIGTWYADGYDWINWCMDHGIDYKIGEYNYEISFVEENVLFINNVDELISFNKKNVNIETILQDQRINN